MSTIARISGLTSPSAFVARLKSAISQHSATLERARVSRNEQQATRNLREEQNSAYERSLAQDRERTRQRREEEEARLRAEREAKAKAEAAERRVQNYEQWKSWRAQRIPPEPTIPAEEVTRISVRMISGERVVRKFRAEADMEELYAFVECHDILSSERSSREVEEPTNYEHTYRFRLVSPMPRTVYELDGGGTIGSKIGRSGNILVEPIDDEDDA